MIVVKTLQNTLYVFILTLVLVSCSSEKIDRTKYFPKLSTVVLKFNATGYLKDTFDDYLIDGKGIYDDVATGIVGVFLAPETMGIKSLSDHYLFVQELGNKEQVIGLILSLSEGGKLTAYLKSMNLTVEVLSGLNHAMLNDSTNLVWDMETAVVQSFSSAAAFNKQSTIALFEETSWGKETDVNKEKAIQDFKNSESHFTLWNSGMSSTTLFKDSTFMKDFDYLTEIFASNNGVTLTEFEVNNDAVNVKQKSYLSSSEAQLSESRFKTNSFSDDLVFIPNAKPEAWFSASLSQEALLKMLIENKELSGMFNENLSALLTMEEVCNYLNGDVFFSYNGVDVREKMIFESKFNQQTGEYESGEVKKQVEQKFYTLALGLKNGGSFSEKIKPLSSFLSVKNGVYNYKEEYFFIIKNDIIYIGTSPKCIALFNGELGKVTADHMSLAKGNEVAAVLKFNSEMDFYFPVKGVRELNIIKTGVKGGAEETEFKLVFDKDTNAVIELTSFLMELIDKNQ